MALVYMFIFTGLELAFWSGEFPKLLDAKSIGIVLTFAGLGEVFGTSLLQCRTSFDRQFENKGKRLQRLNM